MLDNIVLTRKVRHADRDKGTYIEAQRLRLDNHTAALNNPHILQLLDALMDSRTRYATLARYFEEGRAGILDEETQYLSVGSV
jgi:hypothetical protein